MPQPPAYPELAAAHPTTRPLTVTVAYCGCPPGDYKATIARYSIIRWHDDPFEAQRLALTAAVEYLRTQNGPAPKDEPVTTAETVEP